MGPQMRLGEGPAPLDGEQALVAVRALVGGFAGGEDVLWALDDGPLAGRLRAALDAERPRGGDQHSREHEPGSSEAHHRIGDTAPDAEDTWAFQVVIVVEGTDVRIDRAVARDPQVTGAVLREDPATAEFRRLSQGPRLGLGVRSARLARGWSQAELGRRVRVSSSAVSQLERGRFGVSLETALELADRLGTSLEHLLRGEPEPIQVFRPGVVRSTSPAAASGPVRPVMLSAGEGLASGLPVSLVLVGSGRLRVSSGRVRVLALPGDQVQLDRGTEVFVENVGSERATLFTL